MSAFSEVDSWLKENSYNLDDYDLPAQGQIVYEYCREKGLQVPQFKDNRKSLYRLRGYKVADALKAHKEKVGGQIYVFYVNLGNLPLRGLSTVKLAKKLEEVIVEKDAPRRIKLEHGLTRNNLIHVQGIFSGKESPPLVVKIGREEYAVNLKVIGESKEWNAKYDYDEQLKRSVTYLYKPGNMAGTEGHNRLDVKHMAHLEWFLEQKELHDLTLKQIRKLNPRIAWNKNIKVTK